MERNVEKPGLSNCLDSRAARAFRCGLSAWKIFHLQERQAEMPRVGARIGYNCAPRISAYQRAASSRLRPGTATWAM
jgi:hypothetical protein